jgi:hypothetical protein
MQPRQSLYLQRDHTPPSIARPVGQPQRDDKLRDDVSPEEFGEYHAIDLIGSMRRLGITFAAPRHSLMLAVKNEIFDDLLMGNFMKTTLHGDPSARSLYPDFNKRLPSPAQGLTSSPTDRLEFHRPRSLKQTFFRMLPSR